MKIKTTKQAFIHNYPVVDKSSLLSKCKMFLHTEWSGTIDRVFKAKQVLNGELHTSWYEPCDKGGLAMFGVSTEGKVIAGLALWPAEGEAGEIHVYPAENTYAWSYGE